MDGYICEDCAQQAYKIVTQTGALADDENTGSVAFKVKEVPKPKEIKQYLDEYIIGQDEGLNAIFQFAVYNPLQATSATEERRWCRNREEQHHYGGFNWYW